MSGALRYLYDNVARRGDLQRDGGNFLTDDGLETAVHISLLTNRRADPGDVIPGGSDPMGWWGDVDEDDGYFIGSKLWLLSGAKLTPSNLRIAAVYSRDALQWMVDDGVADLIETVAERLADGVLGFQVRIHRPTDPADRWVEFWTAVELRTLTEAA